MAAFNSENPDDKTAYMNKWSKLIANPAIHMQTILLGGQIVGSVVHFDIMGEANVSYWIDRPQWGKGIASTALEAFIKGTSRRPLYGRTAFDNVGSQRVLEKCGFERVGSERGFANARKMEIEEFIYRLNA